MAKMRRLRSAASSIAPGAIAIVSDMRFPRGYCGTFNSSCRRYWPSKLPTGIQINRNLAPREQAWLCLPTSLSEHEIDRMRGNLAKLGLIAKGALQHGQSARHSGNVYSSSL